MMLTVRSGERQHQLESIAHSYREQLQEIRQGFLSHERIEYNRRRLMDLMGASGSQWQDWSWQLRNRIDDTELLARFLSLSPVRIEHIEQVAMHLRWGVTPYYAALIGEDEASSPIARMVIPRLAELQHPDWGSDDPMNEAGSSPCPAVVRRYPDRLIINVTNKCASFCRFCQRRRLIGKTDRVTPKAVIKGALGYIKDHDEIRDVLITGGDPLTLGDGCLEWILRELKECPHVDYVRIGTRVLATLPQRVNPRLCRLLRRYRPVYVMTHFNHPLELTQDAVKAAQHLADAGVPLSNQSVLLNGVNNDPVILRWLSHELLKAGIRPYYLFHPKKVTGTRHFYCTIEEGLELIRSLRGHTSGLAVPTYIINAPGGLGKVPLLPAYHVQETPDTYVLRTWEGKLVTYEESSVLPISP